MRLETDGVYVITGGGGDIAGAIAEEFAAAGARLVLADRSMTPLAERAAALGALAVQTDLVSVAAAQSMVDTVLARFGRVDGLIHAAGGFAMKTAEESDEALYDRMFDVNMRTLFCASRAVLPVLRSRGDGFVAGFASAAVWERGASGMSLYAAAKAAVATYLRSLDEELRGTGIRVAIVYPMGAVDTAGNRRSMPDADVTRWIEPAEIAGALLFAATRGPRGRLVELVISSGS